MNNYQVTISAKKGARHPEKKKRYQPWPRTISVNADSEHEAKASVMNALYLTADQVGKVSVRQCD